MPAQRDRETVVTRGPSDSESAPVQPTANSTVQAAVTRTVLWVAATLVASAVGLREYGRVQDAERADARGSALLAHVLAAQLQQTLREADARPHEDAFWNTAAQRLLCHPSVLAVWILDARPAPLGQAVGYAGLDAGLAHWPISASEQRAVEAPAWDHRPAFTARLVDVALPPPTEAAHAARPTPAAALRVLVNWPRAPEAWYRRLWMTIAPLMAMGAIGSAIGLWRLQGQVLDPIDRLREFARAERPDGVDLAAGHAAELGDIARALAALRTDRNAWRNRAEQSARAVATQVAQRTHAIYQELRRAQREVWTDPLTGLNNRRVLTDRLQAIFEAQRDAGQDLSIVMIDIDHFKNLNDTMGHLCGDELIKFTADLIRGSLRADDIAIRYGGDEFTLLLPGVGASEAAAVARRLTTLFGQRAMLFSGVSPRPSLSAGVASLRRNAPASAEELLSLADKALYEAKQAGRNQVALCGAGGAGK